MLNLRRRNGGEDDLEASVAERLRQEVTKSREASEARGVDQTSLAGAVTEVEILLAEVAEDDEVILSAVRSPDDCEELLRRRAINRRRNVDEGAEPFFDDLVRATGEELARRAPGSRSFDVAALRELLDRQDRTHDYLKDIQGGIAALRDAATQFSPPPLPVVPDRIYFGSRPEVVSGFVQRSHQEEVEAAVFSRAEPRTVLFGMRGSGKTQLAAAVVSRCEQDGWPLVAWVNASSCEELTADLSELAIRIGVDVSDNPSLEVRAQRCLDVLGSADESDRLVVLDNVDSLDDVRGLVPRGRGLRVLVTTTESLDWDGLPWVPCHVGVFDRHQSIDLLCERTRQDDRDTADRIAEALGDLPVAITQAAATARGSRYALAEYLTRLQSYPLTAAVRKHRGDEYPQAVGSALRMACDHALGFIDKNGAEQKRAAKQQLGALSLLAASEVPTRWLDAMDDGSGDVREALHGLLESSVCHMSADGEMITIDGYQGLVIREDHSDDSQEYLDDLDAAAFLLDSARIDSASDFSLKRQEARDLAEQLRAVTAQPYSSALLKNSQVAETLAQVIWDASELGMPQISLTLVDSVTAVSNLLGPDHPSTLATRRSLAYAYQTAGRLEEAIDLYEHTLTDHQSLLGPDNPHTLTTRNNLAGAYQAAGRLEEAIDLYEHTLTDHQSLLGPDHPHTLTTRNNLAYTYQAAGQKEKAEALLSTTPRNGDTRAEEDRDDNQHDEDPR